VLLHRREQNVVADAMIEASQPMEVAKSHLDQLGELEQPLESPKPPPPPAEKLAPSSRPQPRSKIDEDPYKPETLLLDSRVVEFDDVVY